MADPAPAKTDAVRVPSVHSKKARTAAVAGLIGVGLALIVFAGVLWLTGGSPPSSTKETNDTTTVSQSGGGGSDGASKGKSACGCKGTKTTESELTEVTSGGGPSTRSETLVLALCGLGALLFLCGVFFGRIQEVTLPGGAGIKVGEEAQAEIASKVVDVAESSQDLDVNAETIGRLYELTLEKLMASHGRPGVAETEEGFYVVGAPVISKFPEEKIAEAAEQAAEQLQA